MREYAGYLIIDISDECVNAIRILSNTHGLDIDVGNTFLEFQYQGKDTNEFVVSFLYELGNFISQAEGEIVSEITVEGSPDPTFKFYSFKEGGLYVQNGKIVRNQIEKYNLE